MKSQEHMRPLHPDVPGIGLADDFLDDRPPGSVVGSLTISGAVRHGRDEEGIVAIDNGALRLRPLAQPGWGREGVAYGPFARTPGLAMAVRVLNGHNASQTYYAKAKLPERAREWLSEARRGRFRRPHHYENLAVGWFGSPAPSDPPSQGNGFVMHAATADNGELWAGVRGGPMRLVRGVQNLEIMFVVILREQGAAYYAASLADARGLGVHPYMRPLAIDTSASDREVYAGIHQRILGEVGYRVDTRVHGVRVEHLPDVADWYGTAALADRLNGSGALGGSLPIMGPPWVVSAGAPMRTTQGVAATGDDARAHLLADGPVGLIHALLTTGRRIEPAGFVWRSNPDDGSAWTFTVGARGATLAFESGGRSEVVKTSSAWRVARPSYPVAPSRRPRRLLRDLPGRAPGVRLLGDRRQECRCPWHGTCSPRRIRLPAVRLRGPSTLGPHPPRHRPRPAVDAGSVGGGLGRALRVSCRGLGGSTGFRRFRALGTCGRLGGHRAHGHLRPGARQS